MGRLSKDPALSAIVRGTRSLEFSNPINSSQHPRSLHVYNFPGNPKCPYAVRCCIAGKMRTLGAFFTRDNACRFADMVTLRFWKYRGRDIPKEFNFSEQQAVADTGSNPEAAYILAQVEVHLSADLVIYTGEPRQLKPRAPRVTIHQRIANLEARIANLESKQQPTTTYFQSTDSPIIQPTPPVPNIWCGGNNNNDQ